MIKVNLIQNYRKCSACREVKESSCFSRLNNWGGNSSCCRMCRSAYEKNRKAANATNSDFQERNWRRQRAYQLKRAYGMTLEQYDTLMALQDDRCYICGQGIEGGSKASGYRNSNKTASVDHDHRTGTVRGILCASCNHGLGNFKDNAKALRRAAEYLEMAGYWISPADRPTA